MLRPTVRNITGKLIIILITNIEVAGYGMGWPMGSALVGFY